jgi:hypothetical protein
MTVKKASRKSADASQTNGASMPHVESAQAEIEFARAMDEYKQRNQRPFPTWGEVLGVLRELGYVKRDAAGGSPEAAGLSSACSALVAERDDLRLALARMRVENEQLKKSLGSLLKEDFVIDKKAMLRHFGKGPSLLEVLAEDESAGD